jgi:hypothetical protein
VAELLALVEDARGAGAQRMERRINNVSNLAAALAADFRSSAAIAQILPHRSAQKIPSCVPL